MGGGGGLLRRGKGTLVIFFGMREGREGGRGGKGGFWGAEKGGGRWWVNS